MFLYKNGDVKKKKKIEKLLRKNNESSAQIQTQTKKKNIMYEIVTKTRFTTVKTSR